MVKNLPAIYKICAGDMGSIQGHGKSPGEKMATHSSILAWEIPLTEVPSRLHIMRLQRVGHDLTTALGTEYCLQ